MFSAGSTLGNYDILSLLGAGGKGEVYLAHDSNLRRDVAIKVLPDGSARDPERIARLEREAHLMASLNHPNIAAIYDLAEFRGTRFLVLEFVPGETLAEIIARGPKPVGEAIDSPFPTRCDCCSSSACGRTRGAACSTSAMHASSSRILPAD
jgi:serine/threonine protein kinase